MATTTTRLTEGPTPPPTPPRRHRRLPLPLWALIPLGAVLQVAIIGVLYNIHRGAVADRIANRAVQGAPRPVEFLFGKPDWIVMQEVGLAVMLITLVAIAAVMWQRYPKHPILLMAIAATALVWLDPVMNWAPFAVYNPQLTHSPETWPLVSLAPTVEPFIVLGYATFYVAPFFPAVWILRPLPASRSTASLAWRHPLRGLSASIFLLCFL